MIFFIGGVDALANVAFLSHSNFLSVTGKIILQVSIFYLNQTLMPSHKLALKKSLC